MLGNEAIAAGLVENGCAMATSYPGTPSSEILAGIARLKSESGRPRHVQWAVNEKVAFEIAYAGSMSGLRTAVSMKQVGLNVASDPLMSAAYLGVKGGFVVISADDPGPHSSQTEQDSRLMAMLAKIPVLDPDSPAQARELIQAAYAVSEKFEVPVMLRPTTRVCHARQDLPPARIPAFSDVVGFQKDPARWAATPKFRFQLHGALEEKLVRIAAHPETAPRRLNPAAGGDRAVVASGVAAAHAREILQDLGLWKRMPFFQVLQPFPLHRGFVDEIRKFAEVLVIEETAGVIEMQIADYRRVRGKMDGRVPSVGELHPETVESVIRAFAGLDPETAALATVPGRRPTLCAGCPHRASFFAVKKAAPKGIYTSDIGCYTLGMNLGAVDTVLCMGAAVSQAAGFYHAHRHLEKRPDIVATIGDSTFFHAGVPALIDAVSQNARFVLLILDNRTTAMTGNQPTPATGVGATGEPLAVVDMEKLVAGCGVEFVRTADPYELEPFIDLLKEAVSFSRRSGPAVVIARHPCLLDRRQPDSERKAVKVAVSAECDGCGFCLKHFECPAMVGGKKGEPVRIDPMICSGCGVCLSICRNGAIVVEETPA